MTREASEDRGGAGIAQQAQPVRDHVHGVFRFKSTGSEEVSAPLSGDFIICRTYDYATGTEGGHDIRIARPYLLRRSPWDKGPDGDWGGITREDWEGVLRAYEYISDNERRALAVGGEAAGKHEVIDGNYVVDDILEATKGIVGGTGVNVNDKEIAWLEDNRSARSWFRDRGAGTIWAINPGGGDPDDPYKIWQLPGDLDGVPLQAVSVDLTEARHNVIGCGGSFEIVWVATRTIDPSPSTDKVFGYSPDLDPLTLIPGKILALPFGSDVLVDCGGDTNILWVLNSLGDKIQKYDASGAGSINQVPILEATAPTAVTTAANAATGLGGSKDALYFCSSGEFQETSRPRLFELYPEDPGSAPKNVINAPTAGTISIGGSAETVWFSGDERVHRMIPSEFGLIWSGERSDENWPEFAIRGIGGE